MSATELSKNKIDTAYIIKIAIGLAFMLLFRFIPPFGSMTPVGMAVLGNFLGVVIMWTTIDDMTWPSILSLMIISFDIMKVYPDIYYETGAAINGVLGNSFGQWTTIFCLLTILMTIALDQCGLTHRIVMWFLSRKIAQQGPWKFTFVFWFSALFIGLFLNAMPVAVFYLKLSHSVAQELGFKKGDKYPVLLMAGALYAVNMSFGMTPISHPLAIILMNVFVGMTGISISMVSFMLVAIPIGLVAFAIMCFFMFKFVKVDMSNLKPEKVKALSAAPPKKMDKRELYTTVIYFFIVLLWLIPGILDLVAPGTALGTFLNNCTATIPAMLGVVLLCAVRVERKPLLNIQASMSQVPWGAMFLIACVMLVAPALTQEATGLTATLKSIFAPIAESVSGWPFMIIITTALIAITCFSQNVPAGIALMVVSLPFADKIGVAAAAIAVLVASAAQYAFCIPPAVANIGMLYGDEWSNPKLCFRFGLIAMVASMIAYAILGYPVSSLVF